MSTKTAGPLGVVGKLMKSPGLARRVGAGAALGGAAGAGAGADGQGGAVRGAVGGALLGAAGGAASSRIFRKNVGRAVSGKADMIRTKALKPAYHAPGKGERAQMAIRRGNLKRLGNKAMAGDARRSSAMAQVRAAREGAQQQASAAAGRQRALLGRPATGKGPMPAGVGAPQAPKGFGAGRAFGSAVRGVGQAANKATSAARNVAAMPGRAMGSARGAVNRAASNFRRGFSVGAQG